MISVLLPYRDAASTLGEAMQSVLRDLSERDELIAVDDGSDDGSAALAQVLAAQDPRVVLVASGGTRERPAGIVAALMRGLDVARGDLIGRMDADDISLPGRFAAQRELLERDAKLGVVAVRVEGFPSPMAGMLRYLAWQNALVSREDHARAIFVEAPVCHPATLMRRSALVAVGGFHDVAWAEDYDLWLRLDEAGYGIAKVPRVLFSWRMRAQSMTWTDPRFTRARFLEARAHYLARRLRRLGAPFAVWGAGKTGRHLARALEVHGLLPVSFVDIDPMKIGRTARGVAIIDATQGIERATRGELLLVVAVGAEGARDHVRERLASSGLVEGSAFVCAA